MQLGVGRPLLREVLKSLTMLGLLRTRHGSSTFVGKADFSVLTDFFTSRLSQERDVLRRVGAPAPVLPPTRPRESWEPLLPLDTPRVSLPH